MHRTIAGSASLVAVVLLGVVACRADAGPSGTATAMPDAGAPGTPMRSMDVAASAIRCGDADGALVEHPDWPEAGGAGSGIMPIVMSSSVSVGPSRFLFNVTDADHEVMASPEIGAVVSFYALERDPLTPVTTVEAAFLDTQVGRGLYRAAVDFDCSGEWGADVIVTLEDGTTDSGRMRFQVRPEGSTPAIGAPAPRSESITAATLEEVRSVSTDPDPYPGAYERTVAEVVSSGQPALVFFATPAFCQTGFCGPTVELVKSVAIDYEGEIGFVNVEPYQLHLTENGLQPLLDEQGHLQPVQAVVDYGIPLEPYLFLVDADGDVFAKFEGVVGADELRAAIEDALGKAA